MQYNNSDNQQQQQLLPLSVSVDQHALDDTLWQQHMHQFDTKFQRSNNGMLSAISEHGNSDVFLPSPLSQHYGHYSSGDSWSPSPQMNMKQLRVVTSATSSTPTRQLPFLLPAPQSATQPQSATRPLAPPPTPASANGAWMSSAASNESSEVHYYQQIQSPRAGGRPRSATTGSGKVMSMQRLLRNREAAKESRRKKKEYVQQLEAELQRQQAENQRLQVLLEQCWCSKQQSSQ